MLSLPWRQHFRHRFRSTRALELICDTSLNSKSINDIIVFVINPRE